MTSVSPFDALIEKLPSMSVTVPLALPFNRTVTPINGSLLLSNTLPEMSICWAYPLTTLINKKVSHIKNLCFFIYIKLLIKNSFSVIPRTNPLP